MSAVDARGGRRGFLHALNPLAKIAAVVPAWIGLLVTRDVVVPLVLTALAVLLLLVGARLRGAALALLLLGLPAAIVLMAAGFAIWSDPARGLATALRIGALVALALIGGLTTSGTELARSLTAQLRIPYRFAYTAVAAFRFVPRFAAERTQIRNALRVRGVAAGRGPVAAARRTGATVVPLLASSIRHADRVALAMESRAFGAHAQRTERHPPRWVAGDTVFVLVAWMLTAAALVLR